MKKLLFALTASGLAVAVTLLIAEAAVRACPELPVYARVDFVCRGPGDYRLMELELLEPELFFRFHPPAAEALAEAIVRRLGPSAPAV